MASLWSGGSEVRRGVRISLIEAVMAGAMYAATETFLVPLLQQRLGAAAQVIGVLTIISQFGLVSIGAMARPVIRALGGYRAATIWMCVVQVGSLIALSVPLHFPQAPWAVPVGVALASLQGLSGAIMAPAWQAWMGQLLPRPMMPRYMAWRWRIFAPTKLAFGYGFASAVQHWPPEQGPTGFQIVLAVAAIGRIASALLLLNQHVPDPRPPLKGADSNRGAIQTATLIDFIRSLPRTDLGRCTLVWAAMHLGLLVAGPFFMPYFLAPQPRGRGLQYHAYWWIVNIATMTRFLGATFMGRMVDLAGSAAVLRLAVLWICLVPSCIWGFVDSFAVLMVMEALNGLAWCAAEAAVGVMLLTCSRDPEHRVRLIGFHQAVVGVAVIGGSVLGSSMLAYQTLPTYAGSDFRSLFLFSGCLRIPVVIMALWLLPRRRRFDADESAGLWREIPGAGVTMAIGRGLAGVFRRPEG